MAHFVFFIRGPNERSILLNVDIICCRLQCGNRVIFRLLPNNLSLQDVKRVYRPRAFPLSLFPSCHLWHQFWLTDRSLMVDNRHISCTCCKALHEGSTNQGKGADVLPKEIVRPMNLTYSRQCQVLHRCLFTPQWHESVKSIYGLYSHL
jgi:hypothetical protein